MTDQWICARYGKNKFGIAKPGGPAQFFMVGRPGDPKEDLESDVRMVLAALNGNLERGV